jgi:hypothetical protein
MAKIQDAIRQAAGERSGRVQVPSRHVASVQRGPLQTIGRVLRPEAA